MNIYLPVVTANNLTETKRLNCTYSRASFVGTSSAVCYSFKLCLYWVSRQRECSVVMCRYAQLSWCNGWTFSLFQEMTLWSLVTCVWLYISVPFATWSISLYYSCHEIYSYDLIILHYVEKCKKQWRTLNCTDEANIYICGIFIIYLFLP